MVSVDEAYGIVLDKKVNLPKVKIPITDAPGRVLAEEVVADRDFPPFDRVTMDGIAIDHSHLSGGETEFPIEKTQAAGHAQSALEQLTNAMEVMTGAVLPDGSNTVIRYEDLEINGNVAKVLNLHVKKGDNVHRRASDASKGDVLLRPGQMISPAEVALMASVGMQKISVYGFPRTAVVSTGDELVEIDENPEPHQIRRSNSYALLSAMKTMGWTADTFYLSDHEGAIEDALETILYEHDVVIISGGVSKGKFDFIPESLARSGIKQYFHGVNQRPGKPFLFGAGNEKIAFALPGNPVSTYLCFYRYIKPWMLKQMGTQSLTYTAQLTEDFSFEPEFTFFLQVKIINEKGCVLATPLKGGGSGDFANLRKVDGFLELPAGKKTFLKGQAFPYFPFRT